MQGVRSGIGPPNTSYSFDCQSTRRIINLLWGVLFFGRSNFSHVLNLGTKDFIDRMLSPLMRLRINIPWSEANFSWVDLTGAQSAAATRTLSAAIYLLSQRSLSENSSWLFQRDLLTVLYSLGSWTGWREIAFDCGVFLPILSSFIFASGVCLHQNQSAVAAAEATKI